MRSNNGWKTLWKKRYYKIYPCPSNENGINEIGKYVKVDSRILKYLLGIYNSTAIKVYCTLCWATVTKDDNGNIIDDWGEITYDWLVERVGLAESGKNENNIASILNNFYMVGLLERKFETRPKDLLNGKTIQVRHYKYRINSFEEFKKIQKQGGRKVK